MSSFGAFQWWFQYEQYEAIYEKPGPLFKEEGSGTNLQPGPMETVNSHGLDKDNEMYK